MLCIGVTISTLTDHKHVANYCWHCFCYVMPIQTIAFTFVEVTECLQTIGFIPAAMKSFCRQWFYKPDNKTIIEFSFFVIARIITASVCVVCLSPRLRQIIHKPTIILTIMLNLNQ